MQKSKEEVPTDRIPAFELGTQQQIYSRGGRRRRQEKGRKRHRNRLRRPGGKKLHTHQRRE